MLKNGLILIFVSYTNIVCEVCLDKILFGTKTPYSLIQNLYLNVTLPKGCQPMQINMIHRHGNRYPSIKDVKRMNIVINKINEAYSELPKDRRNEAHIIFGERKINLPIQNRFQSETDKLLSNVGEKELYELAKRIKQRFPNLFEKKYSPLIYKFQSSCKIRCTHSANALAAGLFEHTGTLGPERLQPIGIETLPCSDDPVLRFFEMCLKYRINVDDNPAAAKEYNDFANSKELESVIKKVVQRLSFPNLSLKPVDVLELFLMCAYELGMFNGTLSTGLCSLFDEEDRRILDFWYDLKNYYKRSAGHKITYESSCALLRDIYNTIKEVRDKPGKHYTGIFRSAHAETIIPLYALLRVFLDDVPITASNYENMKYRKFRSGCISPFSGNMYFVVYKCMSNKYKIQFYVNEKLHKVPCCDSEIDCDLDVFLQCYSETTEGCNLNRICALTKSEL